MKVQDAVRGSVNVWFFRTLAGWMPGRTVGARKLCTGLSVALALAGGVNLSPAHADPPTNGLVAYWNFDDGTATDVTGNGHDGVIHNALPCDGIAGQGLSFDGDGDYVEYSSPVLNIPPYSVCAWAKLTSADRYQYVLANGGETNSSRGFYLAIHNNLGYYGWQWGVLSANHIGGWSAIPPEAGEWVFLCGTWDGTTAADEIKLYKNGALATASTAFSQGFGGARNLRIGRASGGESYLGGSIDEVRIYDRVLSAAEVWQVYLAPSVPNINCEDLLGHDYGAVPVGACSPEQIWTIVNEGAEELTGSIALAGADPGEFEITQGGGAYHSAVGRDPGRYDPFLPDLAGC